MAGHVSGRPRARASRAGALLGRLAATTCLLLSLTAHAQKSVPVRPMMVRWSGQAPNLSFEVGDFVTAEIKKKLKSGLPQRIVTRVYAYAGQREQPITVSAVSCRVVYDLWEGGYRVERQRPRSDQAFSVRKLGDVISACLNVRELSLGDDALYERHKGRNVYFAAIVELNPLSPDTVERIRRWLSRGGGTLGGDAFFGSFVSIFVSRQMGSAEHTLRFRSKPFRVP